jgi:hypothetical protein
MVVRAIAGTKQARRHGRCAPLNIIQRPRCKSRPRKRPVIAAWAGFRIGAIGKILPHFYCQMPNALPQAAAALCAFAPMR